MASSNPHGFMACREFDALVDSIINNPKSSATVQRAGVLKISQLPLIHEVLDDLGYDTKATVLIKGNNAFYIAFRLMRDILNRLEGKLENSAVASKFRNDLREVSLQLGFSVPYTGPLRKETSTLIQPSNSDHTPISTSSNTSSDDDAVTESSSDGYHAPSRLIQLLCSRKYETTTREHDWKIGSRSVEHKTCSTGTNHMEEPHGCKSNLVQKKRLRDEDAREALCERAAHKKLCHRDPSLSTPAPLLVRQLHESWEVAERRLLQNSTVDDNRPHGSRWWIGRALLTIRITVAEDGFKVFKQIWEAPDHVPMTVRQKNIIWPAYLTGRDLPALRRYQEALVDEFFAKSTVYYSYYHHLAQHCRYMAKAEIFLAYKIRRGVTYVKLDKLINSEEGISNKEHWLARMDFGEPVQVGDRFEQQQKKLHRHNSKDSLVYERLGKILDILHTAYGQGFFAFIPSPIRNMPAQHSPCEIQRAVDAIVEDRALHVGIKKACAEARRLMQVLKKNGSTGNENLDRLKSLIAELR